MALKAGDFDTAVAEYQELISSPSDLAGSPKAHRMVQSKLREAQEGRTRAALAAAAAAAPAAADLQQWQQQQLRSSARGAGSGVAGALAVLAAVLLGALLLDAAASSQAPPPPAWSFFEPAQDAFFGLYRRWLPK